MDRKLKFLLLINEFPKGNSLDVYKTLEQLKADGKIEDAEVYSFLAKKKEGLSDSEITKEIISEAEAYQPDCILWRHTVDLKVDENLIRTLRNLDSHPSIGYLDGDIYKKSFYPLPKPVIKLCSLSDVCFWVGYSEEMMRILKKHGTKDIRYVPSSTDDDRFSSVRQKEPIYDVVMVGNLLKYRNPFNPFPGTKFRKNLAKLFYEKLGNKFAIYGNGWKGPFAKGPVIFEKQNEVYHSSRIVLGVNNWRADYYFSNRLPITLSSGALIVHNYEKGYDEIFKKSGYNYFYNTVEEAWKIAENLLQRPQEDLDLEALAYRNFALNEFSMYKKLNYIFEVLGDIKLSSEQGNKVSERKNPWIKANTL